MTAATPGAGITVTAPPSLVYAAGQPYEGSDWFLFRLNLDDDQNETYIEEMIPLRCAVRVRRHQAGLSPINPFASLLVYPRWIGGAGMEVSKVMVAHQPGWGGRGSAGVGDGPRLWVAPTASGENAWAATARGCWTNLPQTMGAWDGSCSVSNDDTRPISGDADSGTKSCDCNGMPCSLYQGSQTGYLTAPKCMELQSENVPESVNKINEEALKAWADLNFATALVIGSEVDGISFFDNKLDESHVALARCRPRWKENCWLEFHWVTRATNGNQCTTACASSAHSHCLPLASSCLAPQRSVRSQARSVSRGSLTRP